MKVYLAKTQYNFPLFGSVPDLTQSDSTVVDSFDISDEEYILIDQSFVDKTNELCNAALDIGDYQYYDEKQCRVMQQWIEKERLKESDCVLKNFYSRLYGYLEYAVANATGIAIEL